jgi:hypothetical protein
MTQEGYTELVKAVVNVITTATYTRPPTSTQVGNNSRGRKRKQWVSADDTLAHLRYGDDFRDGGKRLRGCGRGGGRSRSRGGPRGGGRGGQGGGQNGGQTDYNRGRGRAHYGGRFFSGGGRSRYNKY